MARTDDLPTHKDATSADLVWNGERLRLVLSLPRPVRPPQVRIAEFIYVLRLETGAEPGSTEWVTAAVERAEAELDKRSCEYHEATPLSQDPAVLWHWELTPTGGKPTG